MTECKVNTLMDLYELRDLYQRKVQEQGETLLMKEFKGFFESTPEIESIRWTQYTPGFNDGDPCTFGLGEVQYRTTQEAKYQNEEEERPEGEEDESEQGDGYDDMYRSYSNKYNVSKETQERLRTFAKLINDSEDILELIFGDGVEVTASKDKIDTCDYDCGY